MTMFRRTTNAKDKGKWAPPIDVGKLEAALDSAIRKSRAAAQPAPRIPVFAAPKAAPARTREMEGPSGPLVAGSGLWQPLGTVRGLEYGTVPGMPMFEDREFTIDDDGQPVIVLDPGAFYLLYPSSEPWRVLSDERTGEDRVEYVDKYRRLRPWPAGTFEKLTRPRAAGNLRDVQPIDALTGHPFLRGRAPTRQNIVALLAREGVGVARGRGGEFLVTSLGGRWPKDALADLLRRPGMADYLTRDLACAWPHDGEAPLAQTLDLLGNGLCSGSAHRVKPATSIVGKAKAALGFGGAAG